MGIRNLAVNTQLAYVQQISAFARHFDCSPEALGPEQVRAYQVHLLEERKLAAGSLSVVAAALRFLYKITLRRAWSDDDIPMPKRPLKLPIVLSPEEVVRFLACVASTKHRAILTTIYASGLRVSEAVQLRPADIGSARMVIRVDQGNGRKDRYVMLSPRLLEVLRDYWRIERPKPWLFPGDGADHHISKNAVEQACQKAHRAAGIDKPVTPHSLRHAFASRRLWLSSTSWRPRQAPSGWSTPRHRSAGPSRCWSTWAATPTGWRPPTVGWWTSTAAASRSTGRITGTTGSPR
jgi:site-specific recombinase XerD